MQNREICYLEIFTNDPYRIEYSSECARDPRKFKREKLRNPASAKIAPLKNFPLYGIRLSTVREKFRMWKFSPMGSTLYYVKFRQLRVLSYQK